MKIRKFIAFALLSLVIVSCSSSKKSGGSTTDTLVPGEKELAAIQPKYADVTMQKLNDGYAVYSGPCTKCHNAKKLYKRTDEEWQKSIARMAPKAKISEAQKDALTKYVFAMRAARPDQIK